MQLKDVEPGNPDGRTAGPVIDRSMELFDDRLLEQRTHVDRMFAKLMLVQWMAAITMAALYSPGASAGAHQQIDGSLTLALLGGAALSVMPMLMVRLSPGSRASRQAIAVCQLLFSSLFIHLSGGRMETHLHVFVSLAWLGFYLDWRVLVTATAMVAADHLLRGLFVPASAYMMVQASQWRLLAQVLWAVFEDVILAVACASALRIIREGGDREAELEGLLESERNRSAVLDAALGELRTSSALV